MSAYYQAVLTKIIEACGSEAVIQFVLAYRAAQGQAGYHD